MLNIPSYEHYMAPTIEVLRELGGSATVGELYEHVTEKMALTDEQLELLHNPDKGATTEVAYRMAWARTYLKKAGYIENSTRGVWSLTKQGQEAVTIDSQAIVQEIRTQYAERRNQDGNTSRPIDDSLSPEDDGDVSWRTKLMTHLRQIPSDAFERLCQRILRECGFVEVHVTGRSGDGGIDGTGILRMQSVVSFHVLFQCKRYQGTVGAPALRDFRGAMVGRSDKGLFITTGTFSREAQKEATRDGAPPIDLIDGERLLDLMKELSLGVHTTIRTIEDVTVDAEWLGAI